MRLVTVIIDTANERLDYYTTPDVARRLYEDGLISAVHCYNDCWTYFDQHRRGVAYAITPRPMKDAVYRGIQ